MDMLFEKLTKLLQKIIDNGQILKAWWSGEFIPIFKKGGKIPVNY